jgi:hypothetical protein
MQGGNAQLYRVNTDVTPHTFTPIGPTSPFGINAIGYRPTNDLLYGWASSSPQQIVTIDAAGAVTGLGVPTGAALGANYNTGAVSNDGATYYLYRSNDTVLNVVNLAAFTVSTVPLVTAGNVPTTANIADFAQRPQDGLLYTVDNGTDQLVRINPVTGVVTSTPFVGPPPASGVGYGGAWFNDDGTLVVYANEGLVYTIDVAGPSVIASQTGPSGGQNDAASCAVPNG